MEINETDEVWKVMQDKFGWNNYPTDIEMHYFEDVIKATKIVVKNSIVLADVVGQSEQLPCDCNKHPTYFDKENKPRCKKCNNRSWLAR